MTRRIQAGPGRLFSANAVTWRIVRTPGEGEALSAQCGGIVSRSNHVRATSARSWLPDTIRYDVVYQANIRSGSG